MLITNINESILFFLAFSDKIVINRWNKIDKNMFEPTTCTAIVPFDNTLNNTLGLPRFTKFLRDISYIPTYYVSILIGLTLGDAHLGFGLNKNSKPNELSNARFRFKQSMINFPYFWFVWVKLIHFCSLMPSIEMTILEGKKYHSIFFQTRALPVFNILYNLFYTNGIKVIKNDLILFFDPIVLAHWIMCDGVSSKYGLTICTDSFSLEEVVRLINILIICFDLKCNIHYAKGKPRIYIAAESMPKLRALIIPHMTSFSHYKLGKEKRFIS